MHTWNSWPRLVPIIHHLLVEADFRHGESMLVAVRRINHFISLLIKPLVAEAPLLISYLLEAVAGEDFLNIARFASSQCQGAVFIITSRNLRRCQAGLLEG